MRRNKIAKRYSEFLSNDYNVPFIPKGYNSIWAQYTIKHENRDEIQGHLKSKGIPTMIYYPIPLHKQQAFSNIVGSNDNLPKTNLLAATCLSLPIHTEIENSSQNFIINKVLEFFK